MKKHSLEYIISRARILTPIRQFSGWLQVKNGLVHAMGEGDGFPESRNAIMIDCEHRLYLSPGWVDLQINGAFGEDFTRNPESLWAVGGRLPQYGITAFQPTLVSPEPETIEAAQDILLRGKPIEYQGAIPLGWHLEGPFINPEQAGAHAITHLAKPSERLCANWRKVKGISMVTIAPELDGALEIISTLQHQGVVVAMGHSSATYEQARIAIDAGVRYATHLFNASASWHHREPGLIGAVLEDHDVVAGLIADGAHVHPAVIRTLWRIKPRGVNLVSDGMAGLGTDGGTFPLGERQVVVRDGFARLTDETLAGSVTPMPSLLANLVRFTNAPVYTAIESVTSIACRVLRIDLGYGLLRQNALANLVLFDDAFNPHLTMVAGKVCFKTSDVRIEI